MDFSTQLDALQQHVADTKSAAQAAASESRDQLRQRIDQAQVDMNLAVKDAKQQAGEAAASARSKWAQMKADAAARMDDVKAKIDKRAQQLDARAAASDADRAEGDAADAIDYAEWTDRRACGLCHHNLCDGRQRGWSNVNAVVFRVRGRCRPRSPRPHPVAWSVAASGDRGRACAGTCSSCA